MFALWYASFTNNLLYYNFNELILTKILRKSFSDLFTTGQKSNNQIYGSVWNNEIMVFFI